MLLFLQLVLEAACGLRSAGAVLKLLCGLVPGLRRAPGANTGGLWLLRIGLFELTRPKQVADDWVWIMDHTVQIGTLKCLLIVGCRLSRWRARGRPPEHRDLEMLALEPVEKSNGATVYRQLEQTREKTGIVPRAILSDEGSDLKGGLEAFCQQHPATVALKDIAHQAAKLLKRELEADARWGEFFSEAARTKQRLVQTSLVHWVTTTVRNKARYMNLGELVAWGQKALAYVENPRPVAGEMPDRPALAKNLGWLANYREALGEWAAALATIDQTLHYVRREGYHRDAPEALPGHLAPHRNTPMSDRLAGRLIEFVQSQSATARPDERLLGSSECLESLIGTGKRLEGQQSKGGFTKMILAMSAAVAEPTQAYVTRALEQVRTRDVQAWCNQHLATSERSKRQQAFAPAIKTG